MTKKSPPVLTDLLKNQNKVNRRLNSSFLPFPSPSSFTELFQLPEKAFMACLNQKSAIPLPPL
jgi:hypothetical protein